MPTLLETLSMILVGALWGCTNPLLRQGALDAEAVKGTEEATTTGFFRSILAFLGKLRHVRVWLPYLLNQSGSLLYYVTLAQSNLSLAVPVCNALALVFSIVTSVFMGERMARPLATVAGAALVVAGVALCFVAEQEGQPQVAATERAVDEL
jgi:drug/metabolite transporter (DMT)-like permease